MQSPESRENSAGSISLTAGILYAGNIVTILLAIFVMRGMAVPHEAAQIASHGAHNATRLAVGLALELVSTSCSIIVAVLLYFLLKPVNGVVSAAAAAFRLVACAVAILGYVVQSARIQLSSAAPSAPPGQNSSAELDSVLAQSHHLTSDIVIFLFGAHFLLLSWLIYRSADLPRWVGMLAGVAGLGAVLFIVPAFADPLLPYFAGAGLLAEVSLASCLLIRGLGRGSHGPVRPLPTA